MIRLFILFIDAHHNGQRYNNIWTAQLNGQHLLSLFKMFT